MGMSVAYRRIKKSLKNIVLVYLGHSHSRRTSHKIVHVVDPQVQQQATQLQNHNEQLIQQIAEASKRIEDQKIDSFEVLQKFEEKAVDSLVNLGLKTQPLQMNGRNFGFFGITSTGKSTIINKLIGKDVAEVGAGETTTKIQSHPG